MKNVASFCTTFLLHILVDMFQNVHFFKNEIFLSKNSEIVSFLDRFGAHSRARRPLHDRHFHTPFFGSPFLSVFPSQNAKKWRSENSGSKGYPFGPFFLNHFWDIFSSVCYKKNRISKISDFLDSGYRKSRVPKIWNLANH